MSNELNMDFTGISQETLTKQREEWVAKLQELQGTLEKLNGELSRTQQQATMLSGAVQSCDFFLQILSAPQGAPQGA